MPEGTVRLKALDKAIKHFSLLELSPKIARTSEFVAIFYERQNLTDKANYYQNPHQRLLSQ